MQLPFAGKRGDQLISKLKKLVNKNLSSDKKVRVIYNSNKLSSKFPIKDKSQFIHKHNLT